MQSSNQAPTRVACEQLPVELLQRVQLRVCELQTAGMHRVSATTDSGMLPSIAPQPKRSPCTHRVQRLPVGRKDARWRQVAQDANAQPLLTMADQKDLQKRHQEDQREIKRLQQELRRKDKALAEAAALLIASKKIQAYWGEDGGD